MNFNSLNPVTNSIARNTLIDYLSNDKDIIYEENFSCPNYIKG